MRSHFLRRQIKLTQHLVGFLGPQLKIAISYQPLHHIWCWHVKYPFVGLGLGDFVFPKTDYTLRIQIMDGCTFTSQFVNFTHLVAFPKEDLVEHRLSTDCQLSSVRLTKSRARHPAPPPGAPPMARVSLWPKQNLLRPYFQFLVGTYLIEYYSASIFTRAHNKSNWVTHVKAIMEDCFSNLKLDRFTPIRTETCGLDDSGESTATDHDRSWSSCESG